MSKFVAGHALLIVAWASSPYLHERVISYLPHQFALSKAKMAFKSHGLDSSDYP
jgi:hypothetical protein